jgi:hypothetical protein
MERGFFFQLGHLRWVYYNTILPHSIDEKPDDGRYLGRNMLFFPFAML